MPELPEVETMRRGILPIVGSRIRSASRAACRLRPIGVTPGERTFSRRVAGRTIQRVDRIGKRVVLRLEDDQAVVFEPRMTGLVLLADPPSPEHLRFRLDLEQGPAAALWFWDRRGLGNVQLLTSDELLRRCGPGRLGPDALGLSARQFRERLAGSRRAIKVALLDQRAVAGIGNLYASEILHAAGIHPQLACSALRPSDWERLSDTAGQVLELAIRYEGSTLSDGTYRNALNQAGGYQNHHRVYDRAGQICPTCGQGTVRRIVQAQRATFFCDRCQRRSRRRRPVAGDRLQ